MLESDISSIKKRIVDIQTQFVFIPNTAVEQAIYMRGIQDGRAAAAAATVDTPPITGRMRRC